MENAIVRVTLAKLSPRGNPRCSCSRFFCRSCCNSGEPIWLIIQTCNCNCNHLKTTSPKQHKIDVIMLMTRVSSTYPRVFGVFAPSPTTCRFPALRCSLPESWLRNCDRHLTRGRFWHSRLEGPGINFQVFLEVLPNRFGPEGPKDSCKWSPG